VLAQFLLDIDEFILIRNAIIICETYFVKHDYFSFSYYCGHDIPDFHVFFFMLVLFN
jgi:hypothetical protein